MPTTPPDRGARLGARLARTIATARRSKVPRKVAIDRAIATAKRQRLGPREIRSFNRRILASFPLKQRRAVSVDLSRSWREALGRSGNARRPSFNPSREAQRFTLRQLLRMLAEKGVALNVKGGR